MNIHDMVSQPEIGDAFKNSKLHSKAHLHALFSIFLSEPMTPHARIQRLQFQPPN